MHAKASWKHQGAAALIITASLLFTLVSLGIGGSAPAASQPDSFSVELTFPELKVEDTGGGSVRLLMEGYPSGAEPGHPALPARSVSLAAPPGMRVSGVEVEECGWKELPGRYRVAWGQFPAAASQQLQAPVDPDAGVYGSDDLYPSSPAALDGTGMMREIAIARVRVSPVSYLPRSGVLRVSSRMKLSLDCSPDDSVSFLKAADTLSLGSASGVIENAAQAQSWYAQAAKSESGTSLLTTVTDIADYVIITKESLVPSVQSLKTYKESRGLSVAVVTTEWIYSNCSGSDNAEQVRNFLKERYLPWGIDYVLLVGTDSSIPMRRCYTPFNFYTWVFDHVPTDYYYSDLSGDWDLNDDGEYGQWWVDDLYGGVDFYPEVYVGRIPSEYAWIVQKICAKTVAYEQDDGDWKHSALLMGAVTNFQNDPFIFVPATYNSGLGEEIKEGILQPLGYPSISMYEKGGISPDPVPCDLPLTEENVVAEWSKGYGLVSWASHGSYNSASREVWAFDNGDSLPQPSEIQWSWFWRSSGVLFLNDSRPAIVFGAACNHMDPLGPNVMSSLLERGAVATVGSTSESLGELGWDSRDDGGMQSINYYFFDNLLIGARSVGESLRLSDVRYRNNYCWYPVLGYVNLYEYNLYGDPSLKVDTPANPPVLEALSPSSGPAGSVVTLSGSLFGPEQGTSYVSFNEVRAAEYTSWSDYEITCRVPPGVSGLVHVTVATPGGVSGRKALSVVSVSSISPASGFTGTAVLVPAIAGTDFQKGARVYFEGRGMSIEATSVAVTSGTRISCLVDLKNAPAGEYDVVVRNPDGSEARLAGGFRAVACGSGSGTAVVVAMGIFGLLSAAGYAKPRKKSARVAGRRVT